MASTASTVDRNEAFAAERREQVSAIMAYNAGIPAQAAAAEQAAAAINAQTEARIAKGELTPIGNGAYRVNTGWDAGETWRMRQPAGMPQPMLLPESNLDESTGTAALYTRVPAWHGLGNVIPEGVSDLAEVLRLGGIDFTVLQRAARFALDDDELAAEITRPATQLVPGQFVNLRSDTMAPLGIVGKVYTPIQTLDAGAFLQDLVQDYGLLFESAGATYGGRHVFIGMKLPDDIEIDLGDGRLDTIRQYLYWLNTNDGTGKARVTVSPWRVECGNTERFNVRDAVTSWGTRHTTNALKRVEEARRTLGLAGKHFEQLRVEEEALARTSVVARDVEKLLKELWPLEKDATDRQKRTADERAGVITSMWRGESEELGKTAYAAERAFTEYLDHVAPRRVTGDRMAAARATAIIEGSEDAAKAHVHSKLMLKVK